jgi:hypothetical protein
MRTLISSSDGIWSYAFTLLARAVVRTSASVYTMGDVYLSIFMVLKVSG